MRDTTIKSRWSTPRRQNSGHWRQSPWIYATKSKSQARGVAAVDLRASVVAEPMQDRQQKAAIRIWEDEGGSIRTDGNVRR